MKSTILCPTDLPEDYDNVLKYAQHLAIKLNSDLLIFHAANIPVALESGRELNTAEKKILKEEHEVRRKLINTCAELRDDPINKGASINYDFLWEDGLPVNAIKKAVKERNIQMVVMGSHGENREKFHGIYLESNAVAIIEEVLCPVFVVPFGGKGFNGIKKVVYALDIVNFKFDSIKGAINLLTPYKPEIAFVHFTEEADSKVVDKYELAKTAILENVFYENTSFELITASHLVNGLNSYVEHNGADLIVMATYKKSFLEKFFDRSQAKKMLYKLKNPVLIMHVG